jgi:uncharacterized damage-inducible protein DinB
VLPEVENYLQRIEDLRRQVDEMIAELPAEAFNWRPIPDGGEHATNSLAVLAAHVAGAERFWIGEVTGGRPASRSRDAEFATRAADASELRLLLEAAGAETRQILSALTAEELDGSREVQGRDVTVRWAIVHVIDHTALHLGHMQITYQLWAGGGSKPSPHWAQRLPPGT